MADTQTSEPTQVDPKTTAQNIVQGIHNRANGKSQSKPQDQQTPAQPVPADPNAGKEKYVVDGRDIWLTPEQVRGYTQKGIAFEPKVTQLAHLQNEVSQFLKTLSTDPMKILTDKRIGLTPDAVLEKILNSDQISDKVKDQVQEMVGKWYYDKVVSPMQMTPEQKEAWENKTELEKLKSREAASRDQMIKQENQRRVDYALNQLKAQIGEAMKESGLPNNDTPVGAFMARRIADVMRVGSRQNRMVTPKEAVNQVRMEMKEIQTAYYDMLDEDSLVKELGEKNAEKVKKYFLKIAKDAGNVSPTKSNAPIPKRDGRKSINMDDFHDYLDELKNK